MVCAMTASGPSSAHLPIRSQNCTGHENSALEKTLFQCCCRTVDCVSAERFYCPYTFLFSHACDVASLERAPGNLRAVCNRLDRTQDNLTFGNDAGMVLQIMCECAAGQVRAWTAPGCLNTFRCTFCPFSRACNQACLPTGIRQPFRNSAPIVKGEPNSPINQKETLKGNFRTPRLAFSAPPWPLTATRVSNVTSCLRIQGLLAARPADPSAHRKS